MVREGSSPMALIVHGGAGSCPVDAQEAGLLEGGCREALSRGRQVLLQGGTAQEAVVAAVTSLENDSAFNAGKGAYLNELGLPECDAGLATFMGGVVRQGAVGALPPTTQNPILVAKALMLEPRGNFRVGVEAERYARGKGIPECRPSDLMTSETIRRYQLWRAGRTDSVGDTVGCVALDRFGDVAVGVSTGGFLGKPAGRVGDVPLFGSGFYVDSHGGACASGDGETIIIAGLSRKAVDRLPRTRDPMSAARLTIGEFQGKGGVICLDRDGRTGWAYNTPYMSIAYVTGDGEVHFVPS